MSDFGLEVMHAEFERGCTRIERDREMFHGAVSEGVTDADWQRWCEQAAWSLGSWLAMADGFVRDFHWGPLGWGDRCDALDELNRMRKERKT